MMRYNDISEVILLGTNLWNSRSLVSRVGKLSEKTYFVDSSAPPSQELSQTLFFQTLCRYIRDRPGTFRDNVLMIQHPYFVLSSSQEPQIEKL